MIYYIIALIIIGIFVYSYFNKTPKQREEYRTKLLIYFVFVITCLITSYILTFYREDLTIIAGLYVTIPGVFILFNIIQFIREKNKKILSPQIILIIIGLFFFYITYNIHILGAEGLDTLYRASGYLIFSAIPLMILALIIMGISRLKS